MDIRDKNTYTVAKLKDGKCWMADNLKIAGPRTLASDDSNVSQRFSLPSSNCSAASFPQGAGSNIAYICVSSQSSTYGNYYNWYAMTAGSGTTSMSSGDAPYSICPKGWRLPKRTDMQKIIQFYNTRALIQASPAKFELSGKCSNFAINGNFSSGCPSDVGRFTCYPTATALNTNAISALGLYNGRGSDQYYDQMTVDGSGCEANNYAGKATGNPVKCIHD